MNPINHKTLALILIFILSSALAWLMSLHSIRLQIGDYYYDQGKFDQAVNWYGKVLRNDKLKIDRNKGDRLKYEGDLSKLVTSLIRGMEEKLLLIRA